MATIQYSFSRVPSISKARCASTLNSPKLSLELLHCFNAVFHERSVTKAAEQLGLSQSTVSSALSKLRIIYADPLFVPGNRGLGPTSKALEIKEFLGSALQQIDNSVIPRSAFQPSTTTAQFQIAMVDFVQDRVLPELTRVIAIESPGLRLSVTPLAIDTVEESLASQRLDLAIASSRLTLKKVRYSKIYEEKFTCILRSGHHMAQVKWKPESFAKLNHLQVSPVGSGYVSIIDRALGERGLKRNVVLYMPSYRLAARMVAMSDLIALMPLSIAEDVVKTYDIQIKEPPLAIPLLPVIQMWHERSHADPMHLWLRQRLAKLCK